jgi:hypothetical protein
VLTIASVQFFEDVDLRGRESLRQFRGGFRNGLDREAALGGRDLTKYCPEDE